MLSAIAFMLMFLEFSVPVMPPFIKMDLSELPALLGAFAMGPVSGVMICFIKNLLHLLMSTTGGVGELSNFLLGACFVLPAGLAYQKQKGKKRALAGALAGAVLMAGVSIISNYFIHIQNVREVNIYEKTDNTLPILRQSCNLKRCFLCIWT